MTHLLSALGIVGLLIGLVSAIDRVLDKEAKKQLGVSLRERIGGATYADQINNPISFIEKISPFGLKSIYVSIGLSIAALFVIVYVQYFALNYNFSDVFDGVKDHGNLFILFILYMFAANIFVDYVSFNQTLVIIQLINKTNSRKSLFVLLFTDLLASINIFTFVYAFLLVVGVVYIFNYQKQQDFVIGFEDMEMSEKYQKLVADLGFAEPEKLKHATLMRISGVAPESNPELATGFLFASQKVDAEQLYPLMKAVIAKEYPGVSLGREAGKAVQHPDFPGLANNYIFKGTGISFWLNIPDQFVHWFSVSYLLTDDVQDNFFSVAGLSPGFQGIDRLRYLVALRMIEAKSVDHTLYWCLADETERPVTDTACPSRVAFASSDVFLIRESMSREANSGGNLPLYTFFFTSLSLTIVIYMFYISVYIYRISMVIAKRLSIPIVKFGNFEEHPITLLSLPIIAIFGLMYFFVLV